MKFLVGVQLCILLSAVPSSFTQEPFGKFEQVFAWKQVHYDIGGVTLSANQNSADGFAGDRNKRHSDGLHFNDANVYGNPRPDTHEPAAASPNSTPEPFYTTSTPVDPRDEKGQYFIRYNNLPMGAEKVGNRLFVTIPRRRYGIPSTLNYIDLNEHSSGSPPLSPYPSIVESRSVISVYRTRADECGRLWAVDTGAIEIPNNVMYIQRPAILVYDLKTDKLIHRYELKDSDLPATNTPTGLASITVEVRNNNCADTYAYIPDLASYGLIVYSLQQNDSWRHSHNYYSFSPTDGDLNIAGQSFQWNDGIFSMTLGQVDAEGCRPAYFHPMVSHLEFEISTCELHEQQANRSAYHILGQRGDNSQSTMHDYHAASKVIFFADVGRDAISCWHTERPLIPENVEILAQDGEKLSYPADLHVTGDEVWVVANKLPRFVYSRLDPNQYNFYVLKANVNQLIDGTVCGKRPDPIYPLYQQTEGSNRPRPGNYDF